jgi:hypothetical protein
MEITKIVEVLQEQSFETVSERMGEHFAQAVNEAVSIIVNQSELIAELQGRLDDIGATGLTPEDIEFFKNPKMVEVLKRICQVCERVFLWKDA